MHYFENCLDLCHQSVLNHHEEVSNSSRSFNTPPFGLQGSLQMQGTLASSEPFNFPKTVIANDQHRAQSSIQSRAQSSVIQLSNPAIQPSYPTQLSNPAIQPSYPTQLPTDLAALLAFNPMSRPYL